MFGLILTLAFTLLLVYILWRAVPETILGRSISREGVFLLGASIWILFALGRFFGHDGSGRAAAVLEFIGMTLLGTVFLAAFTLLALDVVTAFGFLLKRWSSRLRAYSLVAGLTLSAFALVQGLRSPAVVSYSVELTDLPKELDGTVLVALSDAHIGSQIGLDWFEERMEPVKEIEPHCVVFLGDMFEGHGETPRSIPGLGKLSAPMGKWFVEGNHESHRDDNSGRDLLIESGFQRLNNRWVELEPGLVLAGVDDLTNHKRRGQGGNPIAKALKGSPPGATVLLSHTPWEMEQASQNGVGLMLSGHTHGGQIWPFGYLVQRVYPMLAGRYDVGAMTLIVNRGTGTWGPRMRLWYRGEITKVTLKTVGN